MCDLAAQIASVLYQSESYGSTSILDIYKNKDLVKCPENMDELDKSLENINNIETVK